MSAQRVLMILTSHRLDCFRLCMDCLFSSDSLRHFDRVVLMLNGVVGRHLQYVQDLMASHPEVPWDTISGPRGKGAFVANLQNECVRRHPDSVYFKIDEDLFVSKGWAEKLTAAYEAFRNDPNLALVLPVIPNNGAGFHFLLNHYPDLAAEYKTMFPYPITPDFNGPIWIQPKLAEWMTRKFLNLESANRQLETGNREPFQRFAYRFSINCIVYDYRHWTELGRIPDEEEPAWTQWIPDHGKFCVLATDTLVHHYSFFVQQDWLDRSSLLEDIRGVNLPNTLSPRSLTGYQLPRWIRIAEQLPRIARRRLGGKS